MVGGKDEVLHIEQDIEQEFTKETRKNTLLKSGIKQNLVWL